MAPIAAGVDVVVVDLTETTFIDSSSLGRADRRPPAAEVARRAAGRGLRHASRSSRPSASRASTRLHDRRLRRGRARRGDRGRVAFTGWTAAPASPARTRRTTSPAPGARSCWPDLGRRLRRRARRRRADPAVRRGRRRARAWSARSQLGLQTIPLDSVVGTVDRTRDFDRGFRPTTPRVRGRWQRIAAAQRRGEAFPPISVYRIGDLHFVRDGHHRVSVAKSLGREDIDAYVTEVRTRIGTGEALRLADLPLKGHERLFGERVPLDARRSTPACGRRTPGTAAGSPRTSRPGGSASCRSGASTWTARRSRGSGSRRSSCLSSDALRAGGFIRSAESEGDAYMRFVGARYELLRTHEWSGEMIDRLQGVERRRRGNRRQRRRWGGGSRRWR